MLSVRVSFKHQLAHATGELEEHLRLHKARTMASYASLIGTSCSQLIHSPLLAASTSYRQILDCMRWSNTVTVGVYVIAGAQLLGGSRKRFIILTTGSSLSVGERCARGVCLFLDKNTLSSRVHWYGTTPHPPIHLVAHLSFYLSVWCICQQNFPSDGNSSRFATALDRQQLVHNFMRQTSIADPVIPDVRLAPHICLNCVPHRQSPSCTF